MDDIECFFSVLRDAVGKHFTLKEVHYIAIIFVNNLIFLSTSVNFIIYFYTIIVLQLQVLYGWRKVTFEFTKRLDPDLPFYYHTSTHSRFYERDMPDFSLPAHNPRKTRRPPRRELLGNVERVNFAVRGAPSIRTEFHNVPIDLPPLPRTANQFLSEHAYASCGP